MNTSTKAKPSFTKRNLPLIVLTSGMVIGGLVWGAWQYQARNYAEEVASPLEASLVKAGAVKKTSSDTQTKMKRKLGIRTNRTSCG